MTSQEWGIFNKESADWTAEQSVEAGFYSREEAEEAIASRYSDEDDLVVHKCEEPDEEGDCNTCGGSGCPECCENIDEGDCIVTYPCR